MHVGTRSPAEEGGFHFTGNILFLKKREGDCERFEACDRCSHPLELAGFRAVPFILYGPRFSGLQTLFFFF